MVVKILYDNIRDKSKVLTSKSVSKITQSAGGVEVVTADGETYTGDILVGADGIHSTVREEMWKLAEQDIPGSFPARDRMIPTEYCCIFGISRPIDKFPCSSQNIQGRDCSFLVITGPNHRIYWFLFKKLPKTAYGEIPRYTKAQEEALAAEHTSARITDTLTFGEIYAARSSSTLQALPEVVFKKWHYNRIMTIGDAAHKVGSTDWTK
jgi:2-polyprenyl-6-methoxyphenol hydroxylase-like FAD-dependent oxidoreductase